MLSHEAECIDLLSIGTCQKIVANFIITLSGWKCPSRRKNEILPVWNLFSWYSFSKGHNSISVDLLNWPSARGRLVVANLRHESHHQATFLLFIDGVGCAYFSHIRTGHMWRNWKARVGKYRKRGGVIHFGWILNEIETGFGYLVKVNSLTEVFWEKNVVSGWHSKKRY